MLCGLSPSMMDRARVTLKVISNPSGLCPSPSPTQYYLDASCLLLLSLSSKLTITNTPTCRQPLVRSGIWYVAGRRLLLPLGQGWGAEVLALSINP